MSQVSAALVVYRKREDGIELLLAHPGGPFWSNKDEGAWTFPKGLVEPGEDELAAAKREFAEETSLRIPHDHFLGLGEVKLRSGKRIHAWAAEADLDFSEFRSNTFRMEWPPKSTQFGEFPEVDRIAYFSAAEACRKLNAGQVAFVHRLQSLLSKGP